MIFVTGGIASGKRTYVQSLGEAASDAIYDAQLLVTGDETDEQVAQLADELAEHAVVVATEVGSGVHAVDATQRAWRERAGRLSVDLAARAETVVRMVCGIPVVLKG